MPLRTGFADFPEEIRRRFRHKGPILAFDSRLTRAAAGALATALSVLLLADSGAAEGISAGTPEARADLKLEEPPQYGIYYNSYEPAFYTGFAPRTLDPRRIQIHIGRGNQMRVTVVLADDVVRDYADDLLVRERTYRRLIDGGRLVPTQNRSFDEFEKTLADAGVARIAAEHESHSDAERIETNLRLLGKLNPGRIFPIRIPVATLIARWTSALRPDDSRQMSGDRELELVNLLLPTRLFVSEIDGATRSALASLVRHASEGSDATRAEYLALLDRVSGGIYPVRGDTLAFTEMTSIYPVGTWNQSMTVHGRPIPEYPTPGRRALTTHQRTLTIDHVPDEPVYSFFPWLPYMHVGTKMHNAIHTLFWKMKPAETGFLPAKWREASDPDGDRYQYLWLLSRGPMSHGCTHLNGGHISELRQMLPAAADDLAKVDVYYNQSTNYDVFDIDGDLAPEVMGVRYFIAYSLKDDRPDRLRVRNERHAYYDWLYAGELSYDGQDRGRFQTVRDGRFVGRTAVAGSEFTNLPLYEAAYEPEHVQFYRKVDIPFAKALRTVGLHQPRTDLEAPMASRSGGLAGTPDISR